MKIKVLRNTIFLKPIKVEKKSIIHIPGSEGMEDKGIAEVALAGEECLKIKVGDIVVTPNFGFTPTILDGVAYLVGNENSVYAVVENYNS